MTDEALVEAFRSGDGSAIQILFERYRNTVRSYARQFYLVGGETEDLIQEGMMGLYEAVSSFRAGPASFKTFANLCISRRILDTVKGYNRKKNQPLNTSVSLEDACLPRMESPEEEVVNEETHREFIQRMGKVLSPLEFQVTVLYMDGLSCAEISEAVKRDPKSIDNALQRAKNKLRKEGF